MENATEEANYPGVAKRLIRESALAWGINQMKTLLTSLSKAARICVKAAALCLSIGINSSRRGSWDLLKERRSF